jgi:hypothetical protein
MKKRTGTLILFLFLSLRFTFAQQEQTLHFVREIWQSNFTNPAFTLDKKIQILLPSVYYNLNSPDFTVQSLFKPDDAGNLSINEVVKSRLKEQNRLDANIQIQTLGFSYKPYEKLSLNFYHAINASPYLDLNRDLFKLILEGNSQFLGRAVEFGSTVNASIYTEVGFGASYKLQEHISVGGRIKILNGVAGFFTPQKKLNITFDDANFNLHFDNDFDIKTYSLTTFSDIRKMKDLVRLGFTKNKGFAFDLGATATLGRLNFSASIIDLGGFIKWKDDGTSYASKGIYDYAGLKVDKLFKIDSFNLDNLKDTLQKQLGYTETINPKHTQHIPTKFYISSNYEINEKLTAGLLLYGETNPYSGAKFGLALNATMAFYKFLSAGGSLSLRNGSISNLGLHAVVKLGPVQLYGVTDNIIQAFQPFNSKMANGRVGMNLVF